MEILNYAKDEVIENSKGLGASLKNLVKAPLRLGKSILHMPLDYFKVGRKGGVGLAKAVKKDVMDTLTAKPEDGRFKRNIGRKLRGGTKAVTLVPAAWLLLKPLGYAIYTPKGLFTAGSNLTQNMSGIVRSVAKPSQPFVFTKETWKDAVTETLSAVPENKDSGEEIADIAEKDQDIAADKVLPVAATAAAVAPMKSASEIANEALNSQKNIQVANKNKIAENIKVKDEKESGDTTTEIVETAGKKNNEQQEENKALIANKEKAKEQIVSEDVTKQLANNEVDKKAKSPQKDTPKDATKNLVEAEGKTAKQTQKENKTNIADENKRKKQIDSKDVTKKIANNGSKNKKQAHQHAGKKGEEEVLEELAEQTA